MNNYKEERPWGNFEVLYDGPDCKVKRITVYPGKRLSLQSHEHREETWKAISGYGRVIIDDRERYFSYIPIHEATGSFEIHIPKGAKHRVSNPYDKDLVFIEIQTGTYFGEDDITRYEDDFGRI